MTILRNPYVAGNPVGNSPAFIGRDDVLREVLRVLRRPQDNAIVLFGQRRIGKTSILMHLATHLPEQGPYRPVYFDLQDKAAWPLGRLLEDMARVVAHALGQPEPDLGPDPETAFRDEWLPATLDSLPEGTAVVLLLDEFDVLSDPKAEQAAAAFFPYLRGLLACDPDRLQFEFVIGRNVDDLSNIALSVFKGTPARHISLLSREDIAELVRLSEANDTLRWPDEAVEQVWEWTHGHPFLTQQLCSHVWERAYDEDSLDEQPGETPVVGPAQVDAAVLDALDASKNTMEWLWDGLPPAARVVASALAEAGAAAISPEALERLLYDSGVRVVIRELQSAPQLLQDWDLIEPADGGYRFRVELLRRWIAENKPLSRVQEELDHIEPVAENLYQAAQGLYQGGQLEQAVSLLRQAIALNPNHVRANQLLADMLLAQGNASEATQLLEQLYEYQPAAARPRLVQALLGQTKEAATVDDKLELYERVLSFDPAQPEAATGKRRIWEERGDAALESGDLGAALEAYQMGDASRKTWERCGDVALEADELETALEAYQRAGASDRAGQVAGKLERRQQLKDLYQRALGALQSDDRQTAQTLLAQVVSLEPGYQDATRYLHLAVTGELAKSRVHAQVATEGEFATEQFGPWQSLALIAVNWLCLLAIRLSLYFPSQEEYVIIGAYGGAITGLILGLARDWIGKLPRWMQLLGLAGGMGVVAAIFSNVAVESLGSNRIASIFTPIFVTVVSAVLVLWRPLLSLLARWREARREAASAEKPAPLLWWLLMAPVKHSAQVETLDQRDSGQVSKWLMSTLVWLPLCLTTVVVQIFVHSHRFFPHSSTISAPGDPEWFTLASICLVSAWVLTGWLGDRDSKLLLWPMGITAFNVGVAALFSIGADVYWYTKMGSLNPAADAWITIVILVTTTACAVGVELGIARIAASGIGAGVATGVLAGVMGGGVLLSLGFYPHRGWWRTGARDWLWLVAGIVGSGLGYALAFAVSRQVQASLETGRPSWLARGAFIVMLLCDISIIASSVLLGAIIAKGSL